MKAPPCAWFAAFLCAAVDSAVFARNNPMDPQCYHIPFKSKADATRKRAGSAAPGPYLPAHRAGGRGITVGGGQFVSPRQCKGAKHEQPIRPARCRFSSARDPD